MYVKVQKLVSLHLIQVDQAPHSAVASTTKNLSLAYSTVGGSGVLDTCAVVTAYK